MDLEGVAAMIRKSRRIAEDHGRNPQIAEITGKRLARKNRLASALRHSPESL
jgi:hypothetical protein